MLCTCTLLIYVCYIKYIKYVKINSKWLTFEEYFICFTHLSIFFNLENKIILNNKENQEKI